MLSAARPKRRTGWLGWPTTSSSSHARKASSLRSLVTASARLFDVRAGAAGVRIDVDAPEATVMIDYARVRQAVDNLLDNALRYAPRGSTVSLRAAAGYGVVT